jgi:hypothetical protein
MVAKVLQMQHPNSGDAWRTEFPRCEDPVAQFVENWNIVKFPAETFERAFALAKGGPLAFKGDVSGSYDLFVAFAAALQQLVGDADIFLPVRKVVGVVSFRQACVSGTDHAAEDRGFSY